ncbi:hypothetical protein ACIPJG_33380 [Streptomyces halstedii]|uniref:hypothetical protein n=1 Tax=Streptomyces halstedii TaxID=1944 RepID=UPI00381A8C47
MSIVAELVIRRVLRAGGPLKEEVERQEREDNARGPEAEPCVVTRTVLPVGRGWEVPEQAVLPSVPVLPSGFVAAGPAGAELGADEVRVRRLMVAAIDRFGSARVGGAL